MRTSPLAMQFALARLACEASVVIGLRMMVLAAGGTRAASEAQLMTFEKIQAAAVISISSFMGLVAGRPSETVGRRALADYHRIVVANRRRLLRRHR